MSSELDLSSGSSVDIDNVISKNKKRINFNCKQYRINKAIKLKTISTASNSIINNISYDSVNSNQNDSLCKSIQETDPKYSECSCNNSSFSESISECGS